MDSEECEPSLRQVLVARPAQGSCGFHLSRTQWDPYPWVSEVEAGSAADRAGLVVGDCVLEVNSEDVLGLRIGAVALRVYARSDQVRLLVWNSGVEYNGSIWCSGSGPTPLSLQRLASCLQTAVSLLECPVCLETIAPPALQCCNGHTLCSSCRALTDRCPICRVALGPRGRCLLADKLHTLFSTTFLQKASKKKKGSKSWVRQSCNLQLPSRLVPRVLPTPLSPRPLLTAPLYNCPLDSCGASVKIAEVLPHLQQHDGPLVQYYCKDSSTFLQFPVTQMTTITLSPDVTFVMHAVPHPAAADCLLLWLWAVADDADAASYRLQVDLPGRSPLRGAVFPLSWTARQVVDQAVDECIALHDTDFDPNSTKVKITMLSKCDAATV